ncbi:Os03g0575350 [Oryza sativa Japonica Group]|uniref:Os03g0575350 protein n=2 Tax=Oryza sativa subsp. japonica TaxID=39947 RepID=A0A0P0VZI8_ORYSJ|nr:Os03g0575350 [Oryza sativa Japonica Group]
MQMERRPPPLLADHCRLPHRPAGAADAVVTVNHVSYCRRSLSSPPVEEFTIESAHYRRGGDTAKHNDAVLSALHDEEEEIVGKELTVEGEVEVEGEGAGPLQARQAEEWAGDRDSERERGGHRGLARRRERGDKDDDRVGE